VARGGPLLGGLEGGPVVGPGALPKARPAEKTALVGLAVDPGLLAGLAEDPGLLAEDPGLLAGLGGGMSSPGGLEGEGLLLGRRFLTGEEEPSAAPPPLPSSKQK
jgi:hypothetical protein